MSKVSNFFASLNKSTKITLISCGCFIALTVVILGFFIMFPISPDDTVQEKYGREAKASKSSETIQTVTTQPAENDSYIGSKGTAVSPKVTTTRSTRKKNFSVTVTTGDGFYSGGRIPTGGTPYDPEYPYPTEPETDYPPEPWTDPIGTGEPVTDPIGTGEPATDPPVTEPPATDPPVTDPPATDPPVTDPPATDPPVTEPPENGDTQSW